MSLTMSSSTAFSFWTCICGSLVHGHVCGEIMKAKRGQVDEYEHLRHGGAEMLNVVTARV